MAAFLAFKREDQADGDAFRFQNAVFSNVKAYYFWHHLSTEKHEKLEIVYSPMPWMHVNSVNSGFRSLK